jgi:YihY family inner membrane protein
MSTANQVPETYELSGDDAFMAMRHARMGKLCRDAVVRFRSADGFSHSRALAFQVVLAMIPGAIVLIAIAVAVDSSTLSSALVATASSLTPRPTAQLFREAFQQGTGTGADPSHWAPLVFGGLAAIIAGATAFGQIERTANRIYGVEADRPSVQKYTRATLMALSAGTLMVAYLLIIGSGQAINSSIGNATWERTWSILRWPLGTALLAAAFALIFKVSPRRRQPSYSWLAIGGVLAVIMTMIVALLLHLFMNKSHSFGDTYGPLAGFIGVLLWAYLSSIALFLGLSFAAQLEAFRAGAAEPRSLGKIVESEPDAARAPQTPRPATIANR